MIHYGAYSIHCENLNLYSRKEGRYVCNFSVFLMDISLMEAVKTPVLRLMVWMLVSVATLSNILEYVTGVSASFQLNLCAQEKPNLFLDCISSKSLLNFKTTDKFVTVTRKYKLGFILALYFFVPAIATNNSKETNSIFNR